MPQPLNFSILRLPLPKGTWMVLNPAVVARLLNEHGPNFKDWPDEAKAELKRTTAVE